MAAWHNEAHTPEAALHWLELQRFAPSTPSQPPEEHARLPHDEQQVEALPTVKDDPGEESAPSWLLDALPEAGVNHLNDCLPELVDLLDQAHTMTDLISSRALTSAQAMAAVQGIEALRRIVESLSIHTLASLQRISSPEEFGARTMRALLKDKLRIRNKEAHRRVTLAQRLGTRTDITGVPREPELPTLAQEMQHGRISTDQAESIIGSINAIPDEIRTSHREQAEQILLDNAHHLQVTELDKLGTRILDHLDPDGTLPRDNQDTPDKCYLTLTRKASGYYYLEGLVEPEVGDTLTALIASRMKPQRNSDGDTADTQSLTSSHATEGTFPGSTSGEGQPLPGGNSGLGQPRATGDTTDSRPISTIMYDRFATAVSRIRMDRLPSQAGHALIITATAEQYLAGKGEVETKLGTPMRMEDVAKLSTGAQIYFHIINSRGKTVKIHTSKRFADHHQLTILHARDQGCTFPDCDIPPNWCDAHHIIPHSRGGPTDINNLTLVCRFHHRIHENLGYQAQMIDGTPAWIPPPHIDPQQRPIYHSKFRLKNTQLSPSTEPPG